MGDTERRGDGDARWWMGCQPHIRALRCAMHSASSGRDMERLLQKCVSLYMATIHHNSSLEDDKICFTLSGGVMTAMEATYVWLGGWRPTSALLLVYSLMGVQLEDEIRSFGNGIRNATTTSSVLSHRQLTNIQKSSRDSEKKLAKRLVHIQMQLSDQDVLAAVMQVESSPSMMITRSGFKKDLRTILKPRMSRLKKLLIQADQLRLHTLHQLFLVLTPVQVARCAIAAFELAFMMRELGNAAHIRNLGHAFIPQRDAIVRSGVARPSRNYSSTLDIPGPSSCSSQDYSTSVEERSDDD